MDWKLALAHNKFDIRIRFKKLFSAVTTNSRSRTFETVTNLYTLFGEVVGECGVS